MPRDSKGTWRLNRSGFPESVSKQRGDSAQPWNFFFPTQAKRSLEWATGPSVFLKSFFLWREIVRVCGGGVEGPYFHSHILETVLPELSTSYSNAPHVLFSRASFGDAVLKNSIPR